MTDINKILSINNNQEIQHVKNQKPADGSFENVLKDAIDKVVEMQNEAEKGIKELASGGDVTQAIIAMEKADMSFQVMVEVRNKLIAAYEEIMRMQI